MWLLGRTLEIIVKEISFIKKNKIQLYCLFVICYPDCQGKDGICLLSEG